MKKIILASASPRRRELLEQIGAVFEVCPAIEKRRLQRQNQVKQQKNCPGEMSGGFSEP